MKVLKWLLVFYLIACSYFTRSQNHSCGNDYFTTKKRLKELKGFFKFIDFKPGDVIGSVGASTGWYEGAASVYYDTLTFYIEDVDSFCLNPTTLEETINRYAEIKKQKITNRFIRVIGTDSSTRIPAQSVNKIILNNVYHHLEKKTQMLADLKRIARPGSFLYVMENITFPGSENLFTCKYYSDPEKIVSEFRKEGFEYISRYEKYNVNLFKFKIP